MTLLEMLANIRKVHPEAEQMQGVTVRFLECVSNKKAKEYSLDYMCYNPDAKQWVFLLAFEGVNDIEPKVKSNDHD